MKSLLQIDNLDDRREVYRLLQYVKPRHRWHWLHWVASMPAMLPGAVCFDGTDERMTRDAEWGCKKADMYVTNNCFRLAFMIVSQHALDWAVIETGLTLLARGKITPRELPAVGGRPMR